MDKLSSGDGLDNGLSTLEVLSTLNVLSTLKILSALDVLSTLNDLSGSRDSLNERGSRNVLLLNNGNSDSRSLELSGANIGSSRLDDSLDGLLLLLNRLVDDLLLNGLIFDSFLDSFGGNVFNVSVVIDLRNVFSLVFDGVVVGDLLFLGNVFYSLDSFVFDDRLFVGNVFDSGFTLDDFSLDGSGNETRGDSLGLEEGSLLLRSLEVSTLNNSLVGLLNVLDGLSNQLRLNQRRLLNDLSGGVLNGVLVNLLNRLGAKQLLGLFLLLDLFGVISRRHLL